MRIEIRASVGDWSEEQGNASIDLDVVTRAVEDLPWEVLCAGLVEQAIMDYQEKNNGDDSDSTD